MTYRTIRIDSKCSEQINKLAIKLHITKEKVVEKSINTFKKQLKGKTKKAPLPAGCSTRSEKNFFDKFQGIWDRQESEEEILKGMKNMIGKNIKRHKR
jgi:predicted transcriptional regulator